MLGLEPGPQEGTAAVYAVTREKPMKTTRPCTQLCSAQHLTSLEALLGLPLKAGGRGMHLPVSSPWSTLVRLSVCPPIHI